MPHRSWSLGIGHFKYFYNLESNVGVGQTNQKHNVGMVEYMLSAIAGHPKTPFTMRTHLPVSGIYTPRLGGEIFRFQQYVNRSLAPTTFAGLGTGCVEDGIVDVSEAGGFVSSPGTGTNLYTVVWICFVFEGLYRLQYAKRAPIDIPLKTLK